MAAIRKQVDGHAASPAVGGARKPMRVMSAAARAKLARNLAKARAAKAAKVKRTAAAA